MDENVEGQIVFETYTHRTQTGYSGYRTYPSPPPPRTSGGGGDHGPAAKRPPDASQRWEHFRPWGWL